MLFLGQVRLIKGKIGHAGLGGHRLGLRRIRPPQGLENKRTHPLILFVLILDPAFTIKST